MQPAPATDAVFLEAIGLDMSGTISNDAEMAYETCKKLSASLGLPIEPTIGEWKCHPASTPTEELERRKDAERAASGTVTQITKEQYMQLFHKMYSMTVSEFQHLLPTPNPGAVSAVLRISAGLGGGPPPKLFMVSACPHDHLVADLARYGLLDSFRGRVVGSCTDKAQTIRLMAEKCRGGNPEMKRVAYVGDTIGDVKSAKAAGVIAIAVCGGYHTRQALESAGPDYIFDDLAAFAASPLFVTANA